ncbi:FAR1-RELATED SEQUENCE 5 protein [Nymphaea thermarum]|nr:FAR1-RELATED SEQUENCE 5 protein [Nymphaea thermarum]
MADNSKESDNGSGEQHGCSGTFSEGTSLVPKVGMEFDNEVQAFEFYNSYAYRHGFSVRINSWDKNCMGEINRKTFVCYKEGYAIKKGGTTRVRSDARCGCLARMVIKRGTNGRLYVSQFEPIHNHQVVAPSEVHMLRSHRRRAQADITPDATGSVKKKVKAAKENQSEIQNNLTYFPVDYKIYLSKKHEDSFLSSWQHMLVKHDLVQNEWLTDLFNEREKWALAYGRDKFCADIITTQRSESFISVLKRYLNSQLDLLRFLEHYERLVEDQRFAELDEDCKANEPSMLYTHLLREAAKVYTPNVFEIVRKEAMMVLDCDVDRLSEDGSITEYEVATRASESEEAYKYLQNQSLMILEGVLFDQGNKEEWLLTFSREKRFKLRSFIT